MKQKYNSAAVSMLVLTNILTAVLLLAVLVKEHYTDRLAGRLSSHTPVPYRYTDNPYYTEREDLQQLYTAPAKIVFLGTSLTYKVHWDELLGRCDISNQGVSSDVTAGLLSRLPEVLRCNPDICFIEGGANDPGKGISIEETVSNLRKIVTSLQHRNITAVVVTVPYMCATSERRKLLNIHIFIINELIRRMAAEQRCGLVDLNALLADGMSLKAGYAAPDGTHLSAAGYAVWRDAVAATLNERK